MIFVERDYEGIRQAAEDLLEYGLLRRAKSRCAEQFHPDLAPDPETHLHLSTGYYQWVAWLANLLDVPPQWLRLSELRGLIVLRSAREAFEAAHPRCTHCGEFLLKDWTICWNCRNPLTESADASNR
jgi:hypothetical protein